MSVSRRTSTFAATCCWSGLARSSIPLFDKDNNVLVHLGYDPDWTKQVLDGFKIRTQPNRWPAGSSSILTMPASTRMATFSLPSGSRPAGFRCSNAWGDSRSGRTFFAGVSTILTLLGYECYGVARRFV